MKVYWYMVVAILLGCITVSGCSTTSENEKEQQAADITVIPPGGADRAAENGEASTQCVPKTNDIAGDEAEAAALARAVLAKGNSTRLSNMDELYKRRTRAGGGVSKGSVFEMTSKQVGERTLRGSRITKVYIVDIDNVAHVCATVALRNGESRNIFDDIMGSSTEEISPQDERILWEEFKAGKAQQRLDESIR